MILQFFCQHKYKTFRKSVNVIKKVAMPEISEIWGNFYTVENMPTQFYEISETTEVLICEKCNKTHTIHY